MNIPQIYLVEPYNAYSPKQKKKHWMQEVDEQNLLAKIIAEQMALQEAAAQNKNSTLAPLAPPQATPTVGGIPQGGAGGAPRPQYFNPESGSYTFTVTPNTSSAPTTVQVGVNGGANTLALGGAQVSWGWGDGTTGTGQSPSHTYTGTGSFNITMSVNAVINNTLIGTQTLPVTMSVPTVTSAFTLTGAGVTLTGSYYTASHGTASQFIAAPTSNNPANTFTYNWNFGSGSNPTSSLANPTWTFATTSSAAGFAVTLGVTGSFNAIATGTRNIFVI